MNYNYYLFSMCSHIKQLTEVVRVYKGNVPRALRILKKIFKIKKKGVNIHTPLLYYYYYNTNGVRDTYKK